MTNKNKNVLLGISGVLILGALVYFVFLKKKHCKSQADCLHGRVCHNNRCVACSSTVSCPSGLTCQSGKCSGTPFVGPCRTSADCPHDLTCQSGKCISQ